MEQLLITAHLIKKLQHVRLWNVTYGDQIYTVTTSNRYRLDGVLTIRYAINKALKLDSSQYMFLGNKRINGNWITEWMTL